MRRILLVLVALLSLTSLVAADPLYKWVDDQGNVHYSDKPQPGAKKINLPPPSTYTAPVGAPGAGTGPVHENSDTRFRDREMKRQQKQLQGDDQQAAYTRFEIGSPSANETLWNVTSITVSVTVAPGLKDGDRVTITLDGATQTVTGTSATFDGLDLDRGEHSVSANLQAADGTMMVAQPVTFFIQRTSKKG